MAFFGLGETERQKQTIGGVNILSPNWAAVSELPSGDALHPGN